MLRGSQKRSNQGVSQLKHQGHQQALPQEEVCRRTTKSRWLCLITLPLPILISHTLPKCKPQCLNMTHIHPCKEQAALSHTQTLQVAKVQMVKGEREGWQVPLHPLSLEECGAADSASLLASLAAEKPSVSKSSSLATISNLAITPERVAKVMYIVNQLREDSCAGCTEQN